MNFTTNYKNLESYDKIKWIHIQTNFWQLLHAPWRNFSNFFGELLIGYLNVSDPDEIKKVG